MKVLITKLIKSVSVFDLLYLFFVILCSLYIYGNIVFSPEGHLISSIKNFNANFYLDSYYNLLLSFWGFYLIAILIYIPRLTLVLLYTEYTNLKPDILEKTKKGLKREVFLNSFVFASFINVIYIFLVLVNFVFPSLVSYILDGDFVNAPFFENLSVSFSIIYTSITLLVLLFILWAINVVILKIANYIYLRIVNSYQFKKELRNQDKPIPY